MPHAPPDRFEPGSEIPALLHSVYEGGPFRACSVCTGGLEDAAVVYEIQKVLRGSETVFEYAVCQACGMKLLQAYSKESVQAITTFFEERFRPDGTVSRCHFCGRERSDGLQEVSILALCSGPFLATPPAVICSACSEDLNEKLSKKTREAYGDFLNDHFPGIPAEWELPVLSPM